MFIELHKDGDSMGIMTDADNEDDFTDAVSAALAELIDKGAYTGDWIFQFKLWLPAYVDIIGALRGYKTNVSKHTVYAAGTPVFRSKDVVLRIDEGGIKVSEEAIG